MQIRFDGSLPCRLHLLLQHSDVQLYAAHCTTSVNPFIVVMQWVL